MLPRLDRPSPDDPVVDWLDTFLASKGNARAELPAVRDQRRDYRQKILAITAAYEEAFDAPMRIVDLFGPMPEWLLQARRDTRTGAALRPSSRNSYRRVFNSFATWLRKRGLSEGRIPWDMENGGKHNLVVFEPDAVARIFEHLAMRDTVANRRLAAIIAVSLDCGTRRGDVLSMRLSGLDLDRGRSRMWIKHNKEHEVPLGPVAVAALRRYLAVRHNPHGHDLAFLNDAGQPITGDAVTRAFRRVLVKLGMVSPATERAAGAVAAAPERLNLQGLRRTFVRHYIDAGRDQRQLAAILGWHPDYAHRTVEAYAEVTIDELQAVHDASSPLTRLLRRRSA